jgi:o-succinylbenzoate---CoA ligase
LTHDAVAASAAATTARLGIDPARHTWLACLPLAHIGGLSVVTRSIVCGTPLLVLPGFEAEAVEALGRSGRVTHVSLVSTALQRLDPSVFACVLLGGSKPPADLPPNAVTTYGMTETGSGVVYDGVALEGVELALRSTDGSSTTGIPAGAEGEILVRAPMLFRCYRDGATGRVDGPDQRASWFATGDGGALAGDGRLSVSGRLADVITTGAEKVWPDSVERALISHPAVAEVAVWKRPDPEWGERVVAWVVPTETAPTLEELREIVAETVAPWAAPKELVIVDDLPRTAGGKVRRRELDGGQP